jgi:hypothetical protein
VLKKKKKFPSKFAPDSSLDQLAAQVYARTHPSFDIRIVQRAGSRAATCVSLSSHGACIQPRNLQGAESDTYVRGVADRRRRSLSPVELDGTWSCRRESQQRRRTEIGRGRSRRWHVMVGDARASPTDPAGTIGRPVVACLAASLLRPAVTRRPLVIRPARPSRRR